MRLQGVAVWEILTFLLNARAVPAGRAAAAGDPRGPRRRVAGELLGWGALVSAAVIGVRLLWVFTAPYAIGRSTAASRSARGARAGRSGRRRLGRDARLRVARRRAGDPVRDRQRGRLPRSRADHLPRLRRVLATLVGQGLTLGPLINRLGVDDDGEEEREEAGGADAAGRGCARAPRGGGGEDWVREDTLERVRGMYDYRRRRFGAPGRRRRRSTRSAPSAYGG